MWKILLALILMTTPAWSQQWRGGVGESTIPGNSLAALIGYNSYNKIVQPLDNLLFNYCNQYLSYLSSTTLSVSPGAVAVSNSQGSIRLFLMNSSSTTLSWTNLDTGSQAASTTYYVYAIAATNTSTAATYLISASNTAPSGATYYFQIGNFTTDANTQITSFINNYGSTSYVGSPTSKTSNVTYQALTDGDLVVSGSCEGAGGNPIETFTILSDSLSTPVKNWGGCSSSSSTTQLNVLTSLLIPKGNYYEVTGTNSPSNINFIPTSK